MSPVKSPATTGRSYVCVLVAASLLAALSVITAGGLARGSHASGDETESRRLPLIYWSQGLETATALKEAGIDRIAAPPDKAEEWSKAGFKVLPLSLEELERRKKLLTPRIKGRANEASATHRPWIDNNGWQFIRDPNGKFYYDFASNRVDQPAQPDRPNRANLLGRPSTFGLAVAEAFVYRADAILKIDPAASPGAIEEIGKMLRFLNDPANDLLDAAAPAIADIGLVDDGSRLTGEVINLFIRRNLLFKIVPATSRQFAINVRLGTKEFPKAEAADPSAFAQKIRLKLTDEKRTLRVYGSEVVICRLTGDGKQARVQLLNYGGREIEGLRVRLRGTYGKSEARVFGNGIAPLDDFIQSEGATEFSISKLGTYAVIDLPVAK